MRSALLLALLVLPFVVVAPAEAAVPTEAGTDTRTDAWSIEITKPPVPSLYRDVAWRPDGSYALVVGGIRGQAHAPCAGWSLVMKYDGTTWTTLLNQTGCMVFRASWHPDGSHALLVGEKDLVLKFDAATETFKDLWATSAFGLDGQHFLGRSVEYKPDGAYALITGNDLLRFYPKVGDAEDVIAPGLHREGEFFDSVTWAPDGRYALIEAGLTDANGTKALGAVTFFADDEALCTAKGKTKPCAYSGTLYGKYDTGFTDVDGITFTPPGGAAWVYGLDGGVGTILWYQEAHNRFSYPYDYEHKAGRITSMAWQPNTYRVLWTGEGDEQLFSSTSWRFTTILNNTICGERWPTTFGSVCPSLKEVAWHPSGDYALVIANRFWAFRLEATRTPTVQIDDPRDNAAASGTLTARGLAKPQTIDANLTDVAYRIDGGAWQNAAITKLRTSWSWNATIDLTGFAAGSRHTLEVAASDDGGATWGRSSTVRFYAADREASYRTPTLASNVTNVTTGGFRLEWTAVPDAYYVLQRSADPTFAAPTPHTTEATSLDVPALPKGTWHYRVSAKGGLVQSAWSNVVTIDVRGDPAREGVDAPPITSTKDDPPRTDPFANTTVNPPIETKPLENTNAGTRLVPAPSALAAAGAAALLALRRRRA